MLEQGWILSEVMLGHLQDIVSQGFLMAVEHVTCHVVEDPTSPVPAGEYMVAYMVF
jgi:hypothetical protein